MTRRTITSLAITIAPLLLSACATQETQHRDWSDYTGPGAEHFQREELDLWSIKDPGEPTNRAIDDVKHVAAEYVIAPLAWVWRGITPKALRTGLTNMGKNITYPVRLVSNTIQGNWSRAGTETERFAINTTIGLLGWSDAAADRDTPAPRKQDMGLAFRHHGWKESAYTSMPEPTVRDSVGWVPDLFLDPLSYIVGATIARRFNDMSDQVDTYVTFTNTTYDPYRLERAARYLDRTLEDTDQQFLAGEGGAVDTLQYVFLGVRDKDFADDFDTESVLVPATGKYLDYNVWLQDRRAPVMYVLPGTGGHRDGESTAAVAEMAFAAGYHVVAISSTLNFEFIANAATVNFPGFAPADTRDVHAVLTAIDADLRAARGDLIGTRRAVMGISMGALHALYMAAGEEDAARDGLITMDGYYALNPPVNLLRTAQGFDDYFNLPLKYFPGDTETQHAKIRALFRHVIDVAGGGDLRPGRPLPLNDLQAQFLIGIAFRMTLMDVLDQARALDRTGDIFLTPRTDRDRGASYRELARYSFMEYFYAFVLPEQARLRKDITNDDAGAVQLSHLSDLRSVEYELRRNPRIRVRSNANEILLREADIAFLRNTFGSRLRLNESGGHLGNLWKPQVRDSVIAELRDLVVSE